jgi:MFS family permease
MSDKIGRKMTLLYASLISAFATLLCGSFNHIDLVIIFIIISGFGLNGVEIVGNIFVTEISGKKLLILIT